MQMEQITVICFNSSLRTIYSNAMEHMIVIAERGARVLRGKKPYKAILRMYPTQTYNTPGRIQVKRRVNYTEVENLEDWMVKAV